MDFILAKGWHLLAGFSVLLIVLFLFFRLSDRKVQKAILQVCGVCILGLAISLLLLWRFGTPAEAPNKKGGDALVTLAEVKQRHFEYRIEGIGTADANEAVTITSQVSERVAAVLFIEGQKVKKGDLLVQLDDQEMSAGLEEMKVELERQQLEYDRVKTLREKNINSQKELDQQGFALSVAKARVLAYQSKVRDRKIIAPFDGVVGLRLVSPGALVSPGQQITTLDDLSTIKLKFSVPELYLTDLKPGQTVVASAAAYPGRIFSGKIGMVDTRVDEVTRAIAIQALFDNADRALKPGMLMTVQIISHAREALAVPEKCLLSFGKTNYVYVIGDNRIAERREVKLGQRDFGAVEITEGLKDGEKVVADGVAVVKRGESVIVAPAAGGAESKPRASEPTESGKEKAEK